MGEIAFLDRAGGGTHVRIAFDADRLARLASEVSGEAADGGDPGNDDNPEEIG
jgi:two-component system nitrogen regulation sensor histidine kinase NtrY